MKNKLFPWIIALSALSVSGSAAFYSVYGLGKMFAGASMQVMVLAASLEFAKLVTASLLYQYWTELNKALKTYLLIATTILIFITSAGIYGFLSSAYQDTAYRVETQDKNIVLLDKNIEIIKRDVTSYENQITQKNNRVIQLTTIRTNLQATQDTLIRRSRSTKTVGQQITEIESEIKRIDKEVAILNDSIASKNNKISSIETKKLDVSSDTDLAKEVGPLKYISKLTGAGLDVIVNWYIIILMLVFDPLAIALVIASNFAFSKMPKTPKKNKEAIEEKGILNTEEIILQEEPENVKEPKEYNIKGFNAQEIESPKIQSIIKKEDDIISKVNIQKEDKYDTVKDIKSEESKKSFDVYKTNIAHREENPLRLL